ncbi:hypothetical protein [Pseudomonas sp. W4I3]|uniref:hypothetical protein n=1 Tax=Pseudomonas sp. W4I3 TaxID=3042294 RepID=UPI002782AEA5|nr:hypothetical protein [Pseudomonas sp. W4I3]MDQ0739270.1 hypothetical protein [Pseudomonas sp. W4I3]
MTPTELKQAWLAKWRGMLDDNVYRMDHPEAHRVSCRWETRDMLEAGVIDELEKFEMDEQVDAAYWHAVEELATAAEGYMFGGDYDVVDRSTSERIGRITANTYYSATGPGADGFDGKVIGNKPDLRLIFRSDKEVWRINGLLLTAPSGELYDLVQTAQVINGKVYPIIGDADAYRALVDCAQVTLEERDFEGYRIARPLLLSAKFSKCTACHDRFDLREDCMTCSGQGFVPKGDNQPASLA